MSRTRAVVRPGNGYPGLLRIRRHREISALGAQRMLEVRDRGIAKTPVQNLGRHCQEISRIGILFRCIARSRIVEKGHKPA